MKEKTIKHTKVELFKIYQTNNLTDEYFEVFYNYYLDTYDELIKVADDILDEDDDTYPIVILRYSINFITKAINYINCGHSLNFAIELSNKASELRDEIIDAFNDLISSKEYDKEKELNAMVSFLFEDDYHRKYLKIYFNENFMIPYFFEDIIEGFREYLIEMNLDNPRNINT